MKNDIWKKQETNYDSLLCTIYIYGIENINSTDFMICFHKRLFYQRIEIDIFRVLKFVNYVGN